MYITKKPRPIWHKPLSWFGSRNCWRKVIRGKQYYLAKRHCANGPSRENHAIALAEMLAIIDQLNAQSNQLNAQNRQLMQIGLIDYNSMATFASPYKELGSRLFPDEDNSLSLKIDNTGIDYLIALYVREKRNEVETGSISAKTYGEYKAKLDDFSLFCNREEIRGVEDVNAAVLHKYQLGQFGLVAMQKSGDVRGISPSTAKKRLDKVRLFLEWCREREILDSLPMNLTKKYASIKMPNPTPAFYSVAEIQCLLSEASERTQLYILLALNAGFTQIDISTLTSSMIEETDGDPNFMSINRERHKTGTRQLCKLWPETLALLKAHQASAGKSGFMLESVNGLELVYDKINPESGNMVPFDSIRLAFSRLQKKVGLVSDGRSFKTFRKTSANLIEERFPENATLSSLFLAHSEKGTKKYYVARHFGEMLKATDWLRERLRIADCINL